MCYFEDSRARTHARVSKIWQAYAENACTHVHAFRRFPPKDKWIWEYFVKLGTTGHGKNAFGHVDLQISCPKDNWVWQFLSHPVLGTPLIWWLVPTCQRPTWANRQQPHRHLHLLLEWPLPVAINQIFWTTCDTILTSNILELNTDNCSGNQRCINVQTGS